MKNKYLIASLLSCLLAGCNYNVSMVHTEGEAEDIIDHNQDANPEANLDLNPERIVE